MKEFEPYKDVFLAAYHNNLFDVSIHKTGMVSRKIPMFVSRQHIVNYFDENPYILTRVGEYLHFCTTTFRMGDDVETIQHHCFRIKESSIYSDELIVEPSYFGSYWPYTDQFSRAYNLYCTSVLAILTRFALFLSDH